MSEDATPNPDDLEALDQLTSADDLMKVWMDSDPPLESERGKPGERCFHRQFNLKTTNRRVYCRQCGAEVDAFDALMTFSDEWEHYQHGLKAMAARLERLRAQTKEAERLEKNAKARLARAKRKEAKGG